ncbi:thiol-disulfide oxidoreductase DCC family protein [Kitasatospora sp. NPDC051853]|uniref:thiol-disulfide oxidoreductase DCC family protein n=1 Tax=Kitasatospora sp. NPDC051853 TaxID=3364058 RepID=UPI00378DFC82
MTTTTDTHAGASIRWLTVLHDPDCSLCRHLAAWLRGQPKLVPLELVPVGSHTARQKFPTLDHDASLGELTVVADTGEVWRGAPAFVTALWALTEHRPLAVSLSSPAGLPLARAAVFAVSAYRRATGAGVPAGPEEGAGAWPPGGPVCDDGSCPMPATPSG